jgi:rifampin ADP-ribosylating transferase
MPAEWTPVTLDTCQRIAGPFYHGTGAALSIGDQISTGYASHFTGRALKHVYFSALLEPAIWGAELALSMCGNGGRGFIYIVEPTGPFEDDPNLTNKRFPGNPSCSYRSTDPLRIIGTVDNWAPHPVEILQGMLDALAELRRTGKALIEE